MRLEIGNHLITTDRWNFIVSERYEKRDGIGRYSKPTGKFAYRKISFHPSIESAVRSLLTLDLKRESIDSIDSLLEVIRLHKEEVETILGGFKRVLGDGVTN